MVARFATSAFCMGTYLAPPSTLAASPNVGGGTFGAATYFWKVTGLNSSGETTGSNEATTAVAAGGTASLTWAALPAGTTGVRVYRGTATNTENVLVAVLGSVVAYTDTGTSLGAGAPPAVSSATASVEFVGAGAQRDSAGAEVGANGTAFSASAPVAGATITGVMAGYLAAYPAGP